MDREFRARMRGARSYQILGAYASLIGCMVLFAYWTLGGRASGSATDANRMAAEIGRGIWTWGCMAQAMLLPLIVPAFTCGAITLERERDMLELLLLTRQSSLQICAGKLGSGVGLGLTLILSSVPVLSLSLMLGGVSPDQLSQCVLLLTGLVLASGALGLAVSTFSTRTSTATVISYVVTGLVLVGLPVLLWSTQRAAYLLYSNTDVGIAAMLGACLVISSLPGIGLAVLIYLARRIRGKPEPTRAWWMLTAGLCWCAATTFVYLPGMAELLLHSDSLLALHPIVVIQTVMSSGVDRWISGSMGTVVFGVVPDDYLASVCTLLYAAAAVALFWLAVLRVRRLRA